MDALGEAQQVRELISRCVAGDRDATAQFQQTYGELIYGFPLRVYRTPPEEAGDFYLFAFEDGRIFRRLRRSKVGPRFARISSARSSTTSSSNGSAGPKISRPWPLRRSGNYLPLRDCTATRQGRQTRMS